MMRVPIVSQDCEEDKIETCSSWHMHRKILWCGILESTLPITGCNFEDNTQFVIIDDVQKELLASSCWKIKLLENSYCYGEKHASSPEKYGRIDWRLYNLKRQRVRAVYKACGELVFLCSNLGSPISKF